MKRRLFLALPLERGLYKVLARYRDAHGRIPYLRWMPLQNLHVTVLFLGLVEEYKLTELRERVSCALRAVPRFELAFDRITYAPRHRPADMVWAQFKPHPLFDLMVDEVRKAAEPIVVSPENATRERIPHCTLARFRGKIPERPLFRLRQLEHHRGVMPVERVVLFESKLRSEGPHYRPLLHFETSVV